MRYRTVRDPATASDLSLKEIEDIVRLINGANGRGSSKTRRRSSKGRPAAKKVVKRSSKR